MTFEPPKIEHAIVDEEVQMQRYLADIAMEDMLLSTSGRRERPNGMLAAYRQYADEEHAKHEHVGDFIYDDWDKDSVKATEFEDTRTKEECLAAPSLVESFVALTGLSGDVDDMPLGDKVREELGLPPLVKEF